MNKTSTAIPSIKEDGENKKNAYTWIFLKKFYKKTFPASFFVPMFIPYFGTLVCLMYKFAHSSNEFFTLTACMTICYPLISLLMYAIFMLSSDLLESCKAVIDQVREEIKSEKD